MNANRMKYSSTPTYGMQKRGLFKKPAAQKELESPDFSQVPESVAPLTQPAFFSSAQPAPFQQQPFAQSGMPFPYTSGETPMQQTTQIPLAAPSFIQPIMPMQPQNVMQRQPIMPNNMQTMQPSSMPQPLGNHSNTLNNNQNGFSPRAQGYVPPAPQAQPMQQSQPIQQPIMQQSAPRPAVQSAVFANMNPMFNAMPQQQNGMPPAMGYGSMGAQQPPMFQQAPPMMTGSGQQPSMYNVRTPAKPRQHEAMDANKLWAVFLFGVLPLLFIPCLFVPNSLDFLRYLFLALCVGGIGGMWYRQMYSSSTRLIVSVVYVALCIVTIAMMMQGGRDAQQVGANVDIQPPSAQSSPVPDDGGVLAAAPTDVPQDTPTPYDAGPSQAEQRLSTFMALWGGNNTPEMVSFVQPSWASTQENPSSQLFIVLGNRTPEDYEIEDISGTDEDNSRTVTMTATINKNNGKDPSKYRFMVVMIKEGGEWYVDPNSLATNDEVETSEENAVNNANVSGLNTEAPRTTVTPVPPGDTKLYYNPGKGSFYHADPNCDRVASEYLPLAGSFLYSELGSYNKELSPCLKCGAPTQALDSE